MVYEGLKIPRDTLKGRAILTMDDSSWHEELTLDWFRRFSTFKVHSTQMKVKCPPPMKTGSIDGIVQDIMGKDYLLEHKAINRYRFEELWDGDNFPMDYFTQCAIYSWGIQTELQPNLKEIILLMKCKDTARYMEYHLYYEIQTDMLLLIEMIDSRGESKSFGAGKEFPGLIKTACDRFNMILDHIARKHLPRREYEASNWRCGYCGWKDQCWQDYEQEIERMSTDVALTNDFNDKFAHYQELGMHLTQMAKDRDAIKDEIKADLLTRNIRNGKTDRYIVSLSIQERTSVDTKALPEEIRAKYSKTTKSDILRISAVKEPKTGDKKTGKKGEQK